MTHLTSASRGLMHGTVEGGAIGWVALWSAGLVLVFAPLTMRFFAREP